MVLQKQVQDQYWVSKTKTNAKNGKIFVLVLFCSSLYRSRSYIILNQTGTGLDLDEYHGMTNRPSDFQFLRGLILIRYIIIIFVDKFANDE